MRLFLAVQLSSPVKDALCQAIESLKKQSRQGNFTRRENLHLTLAFLGETSRLAAAKRVLDELEVPPPFSLTISGLGRFRREGGDIWWAGAEQNDALCDLAAQLVARLERAGFPVEKRPFKPHLTLGRQVVLQGRPGELSPVGMEVDRISLMKSERLAGILTYTEVYAKEFPPAINTGDLGQQ